jgi:hypothetical protein
MCREDYLLSGFSIKEQIATIADRMHLVIELKTVSKQVPSEKSKMDI